MSNEFAIRILKSMQIGENYDARPIIPNFELIEALDLAIKALEQQKVGKWEYVQYDGNPNIGNWHCSECRSICTEMHSLEDAYKYCPNCGADMRGEQNDK